MNGNKKNTVRLIHVTTIPGTLWALFRGQIKHMKNLGCEVIGVSSPGPAIEKVARRENIEMFAIPMTRAITPHKDLIGLFRMWRLFMKLRPDIVHCHTAKASLLGMLAAALAFVPVRIYTLRGLMIETRTGRTRQLLKALEWIICRCAHQVVAVSPSIMKIMIDEGICPAKKIKVLSKGSSNGVDTVRFNRDNVAPGVVEEFRADHNLPKDAVYIGFIGRIVKDKGIRELVAAFNLLKDEFPKLRLMLVGHLESEDPIDKAVEERIKTDDRIDFVGRLDDVVPAYCVMDIVALPTYREGFPNVPMEAAAMKLPIVANRVTGCVDAIVDGVTGILTTPRDADALAESIRGLLKSPDTMRKMGDAGRARVEEFYRPEVVWNALYEEYKRLLNEKGFHFDTE